MNCIHCEVCMRKLINKYRSEGKYSVLRIESTRYEPVEVVFDTQFISTIQLFSWCFEQSKGLIFCFDFKNGWPEKLGCRTNKFYLAKLITYLHTGDNTAQWHRKNIFDYRIENNGIFEIQNKLNLTKETAQV